MSIFESDPECHQPGRCWCGLKHTVSESMISRGARLLNLNITTEDVIRIMFEDYHYLAIRDHLPDSTLHLMITNHVLQMVEVRELVKKLGKEKMEGSL